MRAPLTRCCCVRVVQPTAAVRCALASAQLQCAKTRVLRVWRGRRASVWRGRADVQFKSSSLCLLDSDVIVIRICSAKRPRFLTLSTFWTCSLVGPTCTFQIFFFLLSGSYRIEEQRNAKVLFVHQQRS